MKILRAKSAGFCFGVSRAVAIAREAKGRNVQTLGELIHNPEVLEDLKVRGVRAVQAISKLRDGTVIIRAHGVSDRVRKLLTLKKLRVIDASCPFVQRIHTLVRRFTAAEVPVVIVGRRGHPEMRAVVEDFPQVLVVKNATDARLKKFQHKTVGVLAQTTETRGAFDSVVRALKKSGARVEATCTICNATTERQKAALALAQKVDLLLVVGGKKSNNTQKLWQLTRSIVPSKQIETERELQARWFQGVKTVGVTAGASTPAATIERVITAIKKLDKAK